MHIIPLRIYVYHDILDVDLIHYLRKVCCYCYEFSTCYKYSLKLREYINTNFKYKKFKTRFWSNMNIFLGLITSLSPMKPVT